MVHKQPSPLSSGVLWTINPCLSLYIYYLFHRVQCDISSWLFVYHCIYAHIFIKKKELTNSRCVTRIFARGVTCVCDVYACKSRGVWGHAPSGDF